ncbi:MAG: hypothetical protein J0H70_12985, partial [Microbacterium chocolatum]|nr:hypothetical protein [Microbacterium chocolatum]
MAALLRTTVALTLLVLGGAPAASAAAATPAAAPTAVTEELDEVRCPVPVPNGQGARLTCGVLTVPERGAGDPENTVALPIIVIDSVSESPSDDPLVVPVLGDADAFAQALRTFTGAGWTGDRDVILVGHRGTELSRPTLDCPEIGRGLVVEDGRLLTGAEATPQRIAEITACRERLTEEGIDIAAHDAMGKLLGVPVCDLIGGRQRDRVPVYASGGYFTRADDQDAALAAQLEPLVGRRFGAYKIKIGRHPREDAARAALARRIIGDDALLTVDINGNYTLDIVLESLRRMAASDIHWVEEPLAPQDWAGYRELAARTPTPVAT